MIIYFRIFQKIFEGNKRDRILQKKSSGLMIAYIEIVETIIKFLSNLMDRSFPSIFPSISEMEPNLVLKAFHSFVIGDGSGEDRSRADFLKNIISHFLEFLILLFF